MNPRAVERMEKEEKKGEEEGFGRREFPLWVSRNQTLVLALVDVVGAGADVDTVADVAVGCDGEGTGCDDKTGKDYHCNWRWRYRFEEADGSGWSWSLKPLDSRKIAQSSYQVLPLKTWSFWSRDLWMWVCCSVG